MNLLLASMACCTPIKTHNTKLKRLGMIPLYLEQMNPLYKSISKNNQFLQEPIWILLSKQPFKTMARPTENPHNPSNSSLHYNMGGSTPWKCLQLPSQPHDLQQKGRRLPQEIPTTSSKCHKPQREPTWSLQSYTTSSRASQCHLSHSIYSSTPTDSLNLHGMQKYKLVLPKEALQTLSSSSRITKMMPQMNTPVDPPPCLGTMDIVPPKANHNGRVLSKFQQKFGPQEHSKQDIKT